MTDTIETTATVSEIPAAENGAVLFVPLNKLKKSPRNARKTPHSEAHIEALAVSIAPPLRGPVVGDALRIRQMLLNYLGNAVKFTETGNITCRAVPLAESGSQITLLLRELQRGLGR